MTGSWKGKWFAIAAFMRVVGVTGPLMRDALSVYRSCTPPRCQAGKIGKAKWNRLLTQADGVFRAEDRVVDQSSCVFLLGRR
jgi:hypothetical protein